MDLIAGPQGSGKSTFFPVADRGLDSFNIDDHRRVLNRGSSRDIPIRVRRQAAENYERFIERHIRDNASFSIEVTLAREITLEQARRAQRAGFRVQLTYVAAELPECIRRVARGGLRFLIGHLWRALKLNGISTSKPGFRRCPSDFEVRSDRETA